MARRPNYSKSKTPKTSKYKDEYCEKLVEYMGQGNSFAAFCAEIGTHRATVYRWVQSKPEFMEAKRKADEAYQKWWEDAGRAGMLGKIKNFNAAAWIFSMKNRFNWSDKSEIVDANQKSEIDKMTDEELKEYVANVVDFKKAN